MAVTKLAIADKEEIVRLYRETDASTNQLAKQYKISPSTVHRLLQDMIPTDEYKQLVSQKQSKPKRSSQGSNLKKNSKDDLRANQLNLIPEIYDSIEDGVEDDIDDRPKHKQAKVVMVKLKPEVLEDLDDIAKDIAEDLVEQTLDADDLISDLGDPELADSEFENDSELLDGDEFEDDEDDDLDDDDELDAEVVSRSKAALGTAVQIFPLDSARLPNTCYMVVDKSAEVITKPLEDFKDLGKLPVGENRALTLPVFHNHRVARRFSNHNQRVVKFPGDLIYIAQAKLVQRGITRLLFDGQVYALQS